MMKQHSRSLLFAALSMLAWPAAASLDLSGRDTSVNACEDFYRHVNGLWEQRTEIPSDRARIGSFDVLRMANDRLLAKALVELHESPATQTTPGLKQLARAYRAAVDTEAAERRGITSLEPLLKKIDSLQSVKDLPALLGELSRYRVTVPFVFMVAVDADDIGRHRLSLLQSGIGLPDREDYVRTDDEAKRIRAAYRVYVEQLLRLSGAAHDAVSIDKLVAMETEIAKAHMTPVQRRDPKLTHNRRSLEDLSKEAPGFDWLIFVSSFLDETKSKTSKREIVVSQPELAKALAQLSTSTPIADWKLYLRVRLLDSQAQRLNKAFVQAHFDYREKAIRGLQTQAPLAERTVIDLGGGTGGEPLGPALGELFVRKAFSPRAQTRANEMIEDIRAAMQDRIRSLEWMSEPTKQKALEKLANMKALIGAPSLAKDYSGLTLAEDDYAGNSLRIAAWDTRVRAQRLNEAPDRGRWESSAHIVNAFAATQNRIVFPAGILQPPFFDENADDAVNFGAIGMVIGHEITHHFDDRGRQYDASGRLKDWWSEADAKAYVERATKVANLYSTYQPLPGEFINGRQMLGENISDLGGMHIAYHGLQRALKRKRDRGEAVALVDGLTPEQRFFASNAIVWRGKMRNEALINQLRTGQHSPGPFRVRGPMSNMPQFAEAFSCKPGDAMAALTPITVW
jgi:putative endopeptidase